MFGIYELHTADFFDSAWVRIKPDC